MDKIALDLEKVITKERESIEDCGNLLAVAHNLQVILFLLLTNSHLIHSRIMHYALCFLKVHEIISVHLYKI